MGGFYVSGLKVVPITLFTFHWRELTCPHVTCKETGEYSLTMCSGRMDFGRLLAVSASVFQPWPFFFTIHTLLIIPTTHTHPSPRETTQKSYLVTTCGSKSSFSGLCSVFSIRCRYGYPLTPNIEWWGMDRITTMTHSKKGRMENIAATVHRKQIVKTSCAGCKGSPLVKFCFCSLDGISLSFVFLSSLWKFFLICYLPWPPLNWAMPNRLAALHFKVPDLY